MPKSAISGLYDKSTFSFDRDSQSIFQSGYTNLHSHP